MKAKGSREFCMASPHRQLPVLPRPGVIAPRTILANVQDQRLVGPRQMPLRRYAPCGNLQCEFQFCFPALDCRTPRTVSAESIDTEDRAYAKKNRQVAM